MTPSAWSKAVTRFIASHVGIAIIILDLKPAGRKKILGSLADHPAINRDQVSTPKLHERCERKREETIAEQLPFYMGFAPSPALYAAHQTELDALCAKLIQLGSYYFPKTDMLNAVNPWSHMLHIADFSLLFRIYPLLKRCMAFDLGYLCTLITDSSFIYEPLEPTTPQWQTERDEPHYAAYVATQIAPYAVQEAAHLEALHHEIRQFITDYDLLWEDMLQSSAQDRLAAEARAYAINEDRRYLMPPFSLSTALGEMAAETPEDRLSTLIQRVIDASLRSPDAWPLRTELQCYAEGYACILLDGQGEHTNQLVIEDPMLIERIVAAKQVTITIDEHHFTPALNPQNSGLFLISPPQDNDALIEACTRSASYLVKKIMVNLDGTDYSLNEFGHP